MRTKICATPEQSDQSWAQIEANMGLIKYIVCKYTRGAAQEDRDDYVQGAALFIHSRLHMHDERSSFSNYIGKLAQWYILKERTRTRYKAHGMETISIDDKISDGSAFTHEQFLADTRMDVEHDVIEDSRHDAVCKSLDVLDDRERRMVEMVYWHDKTIFDAAEMGGISGGYGSAIMDKALRKIGWAYHEATK